MKNIILFIFVTSMFACQKHTEMRKLSNSVEIDVAQIENEKDPVCNMSVREHLSDTALINDQVWGFCSSVCKEKYLHLK